MNPTNSLLTAGRRFRSLAMAVTVLAAAALFLACEGPGPPEPAIDIPDGAPLVDQDARNFIPSSLTVSVGEDVYFLNSVRPPHTVTINGQNISGHMERGDVVVYTFEEPGEYDLTCDYHPQMRGTITVVE